MNARCGSRIFGGLDPKRDLRCLRFTSLKRSVAIALVLSASWGATTSAQDNDFVLNYSDPAGADLALAMLVHAEELPAWVRNAGTASSDEQIGITVQRSAGRLPRYTMSVPHLGGGTGASDTSRVEIGQTIALLRTEAEPSVDTGCGKTGAGTCRLSKTATEIAALLAKGPLSNQRGLKAIMESKGLVLDNHSVRRVVGRVGGDGAVEHVDFIGVVRRHDKTPTTPDGTPNEVLRVYSDGRYEIVERRPDVPVNLRDVKFGFESAQ